MALTTPGTAPADLTQHPIIETLTSEGWTYNPEDSQPKFWLVFERKTKSGIFFEIQFFLDRSEAAYFIKGADFGSPYDSVEATLKEVNRYAEMELFGGWA